MITGYVDHGFYQIGLTSYASKIEALFAGAATNTQPSFNFHDDAYGKFNWAVEPSETLDQLYLARALELRNKYDYLVLHYSAGPDSNNILETFVRHKIPLDEIFMRGTLDSVDKNERNTTADNMFAEVFFNAYPIALHIKDTYMPNVVVRVVDNTEYIVNSTKDDAVIASIFDPSNLGVGGVGPNLIASKDYDNLVPEWRRMTENGKKVCHILGAEKPSVSISAGEYSIQFLDKAILHLSQTRATKIDVPIYKEFFYWGETTAPIIIKQAHTIKEYIKANNMAERYMSVPRNRVWHDFIAGIIYRPRLFPITFNTEKILTNTPLMPWDNFFMKDVHATHYVNWRKHVDHLNSIIPDNFKHVESPVLNLKGIFSKKYIIGN